MTDRKPARISFESWVEKQIREAAERGEFDDLPGLGKPLPGAGRPDEELWWVKQKLREEELTTEALLPTSLRLRKEIERLPETAAGLPTERAVREMVDDLNARIGRFLRTPTGPAVPVRPVNADDVVRQWHQDWQRLQERRAAARRNTRGEVPPATRVRWWHRLTGRRR